MPPKECVFCEQYFIGVGVVCSNCLEGYSEPEKVMRSSTDLDKELLISALRNELVNKRIVIQRLMNVLVEKQDKILELEERIFLFGKDNG